MKVYVGERGPEIFIKPTKGRILSSDEMRDLRKKFGIPEDEQDG